MTSATSANTVPLAARVSRLLRHARTHGSARASYAVLQAALSMPVLRTCLRLGVVEVFHVSLGDWKSAPRIPSSFQVRQATSDDEPALGQYFGDQRKVRARFRRGDRCFLTLCRKEIGAAAWLAVGPSDYREDWGELRCAFQFPLGSAWCFDGKGSKWGAWGSLMARLPEYLPELGVREIFTLIDCNNWQSIDSHRSLGFQSIGLIGCFGTPGLSRCVCRPYGRRWRFLPGEMGNLTLLDRLPNLVRGNPHPE